MADTFLVIGTGPTVNIVLSGAGTPYTAGTGIAVSGANVISNTAPDQTVTMTDGTGIDVTGTYPNFTITNTSPNVVQTLSIAGQDLTLSGGGGTVAIPGGASDALGTGFTSGGGTGTIPAGTFAETDNLHIGETNSGIFYKAVTPYQATGDGFHFTGFEIWDGVSGQSNAFGYNNDEETFIMSATNGSSSGAVSLDGTGYVHMQSVTPSGSTSFDMVSGQMLITDSKATPLGAVYNGNYSATIITNPTSLTDVTSVNLLIGKKAFNGNYTATGTATTAFTVTLPVTMPDATYTPSITPKNALSATGWYISARTTTTFTVTYLTGLTGAVDFDYIVVN